MPRELWGGFKWKITVLGLRPAPPLAEARVTQLATASFSWHVIWNYMAHIFWDSFWHSIWHLLSHSIWNSIWHLFWHSIWRSFLAGILTSFSGLCSGPCVKPDLELDRAYSTYRLRVRVCSAVEPWAERDCSTAAVISRFVPAVTRWKRRSCIFVEIWRPSPGKWGIRPIKTKIPDSMHFFSDCSCFSMLLRLSGTSGRSCMLGRSGFIHCLRTWIQKHNKKGTEMFWRYSKDNIRL